MNELQRIDTPQDAKQAFQTLDHSPTPMDLIQRAVQSNAQVETMEKLMGLQERYERNEARKAFDSAISKAKSEIPVIRKGNLVDFTSQKGRTHYSYEDLATIAATIDPILSKYGLSYRFRTNSDSKAVTITCVLSHSAGHCEENSLYAPHDASGNKNPIQAVGSAVTYLQRYTLKAALGLAAAADDDARGATPQPQQSAPATQRQQTPPQTAPKATAQAKTSIAGDGPIALPVCTVKMVTEVDGLRKSDGKPWKRYDVLLNDGFTDVQCATFSRTIGEMAEDIERRNVNCEATVQKTDRGMTLVSILEKTEGTPNNDQPAMDFDDKGNPVQEGVTP